MSDRIPAAGELTNTATMTSDRIVVVQFVVAPFAMYQLSARVAGGEGSIEPRRGTYPGGTVVELAATPADGYHVAGWTGTDDDASVATSNTVTMNGNRTVAVKFAPDVDCNSDGIPDQRNLQDGDSADCNSNGVPDECEPDADGDGLIDACDDRDDSAMERPEVPGPGLGLCGVGFAETLVFSLIALGFLHRRVRRMLLAGDRPGPPKKRG